MNLDVIVEQILGWMRRTNVWGGRSLYAAHNGQMRQRSDSALEPYCQYRSFDVSRGQFDIGLLGGPHGIVEVMLKCLASSKRPCSFVGCNSSKCPFQH